MELLDDREQIELFISCRSLKDMDLMSKSDPQVIMLVQNNNNLQWTEVGRTECIDNNLNPDFAKTFTFDFIFEQQQHVRFQCIDIDVGQAFDFIGEATTTISSIVGARSSMIVLDLMNKNKKCGKIIIRAERTGNNNDILIAKPRIENIQSQRWFSNTKPFIRLTKSTEDNQNIKVYESDYKTKTTISFEQFSMKLSKLCNSDRLRPITLEVWDYHKNGDHKLIGTTKFSVQSMEHNKVLSVTNRKSGKEVGRVVMEVFRVESRPQFIDYIRGGTELNLLAAIDFTGSNGTPSQPSSLHYINPSNRHQLNQYQQALHSIGEILINYDHSQMVPVFGFGGKPLPLTRQVMHCFPINFQPQEPRVFGLSGIMQAYQNALPQIELAGPTLFNPLLQEVNKVCINNQHSNKYYLLLILTDGAIHDMEQTIESIFQAVHLPLSIVIIGVGNADFTNMNILDGDEGLFNNRGQKCQRDLVQFVPYNQFKNNPQLLAKNVLEELPDQLVNYYLSQKVLPGPPKVQDINQINLNPVKDIQGAAQLMAGQQQQPNFLDQLIQQQMPNYPDINQQQQQGYDPQRNQQANY